MKGVFFGVEPYNLDNYLKHRNIIIQSKDGAVDVQFSELGGMINITKFARRFMNKSQSWFSQRLHGCLVMKKEQSFNEEEYKKIAEGFRELARQLNQYADEIDKAEM